MSNKQFIKLKFIAESFSSSIKQSDVQENADYPVYGASGHVGYLDTYGYDKRYIGIVKDGAGVGRTGIYEGFSSLLATLSYIIPRDETNTSLEYLKYSIDALNLEESYGEKATIPHIYFSVYGNYKILNIPHIEQKKLASYLDDKTKKIEQLISNQQQQIEKLKEYKQSLISEVVTKGLDPNVGFKDSGIDWIGKIPVHWNIVPLKYSSNITMGQSPKSESYNTEQVGKPFLGGNSDITDGFSSPKYYTKEITKTCKKGDILMSVRAPVGTIAKSLHDAVLGRGLCSIKSKISNDFTYFYMCFLENKWNEYITGTTFDSVNADDIKNMPYVLAPADEILHLLEYMNNKIKLIDRLIKIMVDKVVCLNDYKKSLIYEYVTGKKEVS